MNYLNKRIEKIRNKKIKRLFLIYTTGFLLCVFISFLKGLWVVSLLAFIYMSVCSLMDYSEITKAKWQ